MAVSIGNTEKLKEQVKRIACINKRDVLGGNGRSLLHHAAINGQEDCIDVLLQTKRVNINLPTLLGRDTALHLAALKSNRNIVSKLLQHGANPNIRNAHGSTPLHYTTDKQIAQLLVTFGGDVTVKNSSQKKPVDCVFPKDIQNTNDLIQFLTNVEDAVSRQRFQESLEQNRKEKKNAATVIQMLQEADRVMEDTKRRKERMMDYLSWRRCTSIEKEKSLHN